MVAVKTTEGGRWILPQIEAMRSRGTEVVVLLPEGKGRLATEVTALADRDADVRLLRAAALDGLKDRGDASRRFIVAHFDQQSSTEKVADQVCGGVGTGEFSIV